MAIQSNSSGITTPETVTVTFSSSAKPEALDTLIARKGFGSGQSCKNLLLISRKSEIPVWFFNSDIVFLLMIKDGDEEKAEEIEIKKPKKKKKSKNKNKDFFSMIFCFT